MRKVFFAVAVVLTLACLMPAPAAQAAPDASAAPAAPAVPFDPAVQAAPVAPEACPAPPAVEGRRKHRLGLGLNYWKAIDNLGENADSDSFSYIISYDYAPLRYLKIGTQLEFFPSIGGLDNVVWEPELFVTAGGLFYAGVGIGLYYFDGDFGSQPFYMLRAGLDIPVLSHLFLDINFNYSFDDWETLNVDELNTDTIRLGAAIRYAL